MRVLQVSDSLSVRYGGTAASCAHLANHLAGAGVETSVVTLAADRQGPRWPLAPSVIQRVCHPVVPHPLAYCPGLAAIVSSPPRPQVVHVHGLWRLHYWQATRVAHKANVPVLVSVHGMLHQLALAEKATSKRLARWLYQDDLLRRAQCLHVTAPEEADQVRALGCEGPVAVIPWGVDLPTDERTPLDAERHPDSRQILYLGRLAASKGLEPLLRAWARVAPQCPGWRLVIAGAGRDRYEARVRGLAADLGVADSTIWVGEVDGAERERVFREASLLVLPSSYENFGLVVAEALARGVPAIATHGAPWSALARERCGWWVPVGEDDLVGALSDALSHAEDLPAMGARGRAFVRAGFAWDATARAMRRLYEWLDGGPRPSFVTP